MVTVTDISSVTVLCDSASNSQNCDIAMLMAMLQARALMLIIMSLHIQLLLPVLPLRLRVLAFGVQIPEWNSSKIYLKPDSNIKAKTLNPNPHSNMKAKSKGTSQGPVEASYL